MNLSDKINEGIKEAMKAKDKVRLDTLRGVKKEFIEAKTAKGASDELSDEAAILIIQKMVKQRKDSAAIFKTQGREDLATDELAQVAVLEEYLPKQLTAEELETELKKIIAEVGASSPADMGKVMGAATKKLAGIAAGKDISETTKRLLNQ
ncbi:GatB/YqeY domain-containing protein [Dysgonomonas sp. 25]|uniref:GatB/YqeY domain-containing protein n=1 Tax=Dysgonomonas sp. 25 TaxID=2302933 RepID=UPI0013D6B2FC|nr:GatB/YqeY domain-containing protein [Dysgonomonas sp. 25]NDV68713.1 GatB/YqeY domain-containing protein [Dysgonomonas sp. 25]